MNIGLRAEADSGIYHLLSNEIESSSPFINVTTVKNADTLQNFSNQELEEIAGFGTQDFKNDRSSIAYKKYILENVTVIIIRHVRRMKTLTKKMF